MISYWPNLGLNELFLNILTANEPGLVLDVAEYTNPNEPFPSSAPSV